MMSARATCRCGWTKVYPTTGAAEFNARRHVCRKQRGVRRATRRYRCARCGLEATYENASAAEARRWFSLHSCRKREDAMLRSAQAQAREALIDRTPKPCDHKVANHQHGTRACYVLDQCRCLPCANANSAAENERERMKAYGRYHKYVNAEHVRTHLAELRDYGIGLKHVSKLSGVSNGSLTKIVYGTYATTGRGKERRLGEGEFLRGPARRVLRSTAEAIFAIEPIPANLPAVAHDHERTPLARTHLQALVALGWSMSLLASRLGMSENSRGNLSQMLGDGRTFQRGMVDRIEALYEQLSMTLPPETNQRERISVSRSRRLARERGWLPPLELEDVDGVTVEDDVDEVAVHRRAEGDTSVALTPAEQREVVRLLHGQGLIDTEAARRTGFSADLVRKLRNELGLPANVPADRHLVSSNHFKPRPRAEAVAS